MNEFKEGQIVQGAVCGYFEIIKFRRDLSPTELYVELKAVNPQDFSQMAPGKIALPVDSIKPLENDNV